MCLFQGGGFKLLLPGQTLHNSNGIVSVKYSGSHLISYRLIKYRVYYHTNPKSETISYAFPYVY
jgi:hypothetical protein